MSTSELIVLAGAFAGGFVNGLTGFGTGLTALTFWLHVTSPAVAAPMVVICSVIGQLQTLPAIWHAITWSRVMPFIVGGLLGVPVGTYLLILVPVGAFKVMVGSFLVIYCGFMLLSRRVHKITWGGRGTDALVGFGGGILGGLAGISGALPSLWAGLRGWGKDERRGVFQAFNLTILAIAGVSQTIGGFMTSEVGRLILFALPGTLIGVWIGRKSYDRLSEMGFDRIVLAVLLVSGVAMIAITLEGHR